MIPATGVYASLVHTTKGIFEGMTNVGKKPTIKGDYGFGVETHMFDFDYDLYGTIVRTELLHHTRAEYKFEDIEALKARLIQDREQVMCWFKNNFPAM